MQPSKVYAISFQTRLPPAPTAENWEDVGGRRGSRERETRGTLGGTLPSASLMRQWKTHRRHKGWGLRAGDLPVFGLMAGVAEMAH